MSHERIAIVGSRHFRDTDQVVRKVLQLCAMYPDAEFVSGGARGVDTIAMNIAKLHGHPIRVFGAEWGRLGKAAGPIRNTKIVGYSTDVYAFWDGESRGTKDSIEKARKAGKLREVVKEVPRHEP